MKKVILAILNFLGIAQKNPKLNPLDNPPPREFRNLRIVKKAVEMLGTKEWKNGSNPQIEEFHRYADRHNIASMTDDVAWCSSFICWVCEKVGIGSTNSRAARSWTRWGISTKKNPLPGDIIVFWRGSRGGWQGHVGIYLDHTAEHFIVLGGNQSDSVNITRYPKSKLLDIRRSSLHKRLSASEKNELTRIAYNLIKTGQIEPEGSVK